MGPTRILDVYSCTFGFDQLTVSSSQTSFCTILCARSYSAHISWHVPTGVIASAKDRGFSGSAIRPWLIALARSRSRALVSYTEVTISAPSVALQKRNTHRLKSFLWIASSLCAAECRSLRARYICAWSMRRSRRLCRILSRGLAKATSGCRIAAN
jgi:hypothetical protein